MALLSSLLYPLAALPILRIGRRIRRASSGMQDRWGRRPRLLVESFSAARVVRAYRLEEAEEARAAHAFARLKDSQLSIQRPARGSTRCWRRWAASRWRAVLGFVGWRVSTGSARSATSPGFVAALLIAARPCAALGSLNAALQEGLAGLSRVFAVVDDAAAHRRRAGCAPAAARARPRGLRGRGLHL
jgi:subfamily B ATP-binding cassette protein MsbA